MMEETLNKYNLGLEMYLGGMSTAKISKELKISRSRFFILFKKSRYKG